MVMLQVTNCAKWEQLYKKVIDNFGSCVLFYVGKAYCFYMNIFLKKSEFYIFWQCLLLNLIGNPISIFHFL
jgi:hypothetical protein